MDKPIAIWGTDIEAAKIYYKLERDGQYVETFFDNRIEEDTYFLDKSVRKPTAEQVKKYFVYVGCKYHTYRTIADQLEGYGMEEIKDFLWYDLFKKKIVILHGNCHMEILRQYFLATRGFGVGGGYGIYPTELIHNNKKGYLNESVLHACDILIQQDVRDENTYGYKLGTNYFK